MLKKIGTDDMRKKMGEILDCVNLRGDEFIIERKNKPIAGLIPMKKMIALREMAKNFVLEFLDSDETNLTDAEVHQLVDQAIHKTRKSKKKK